MTDLMPNAPSCKDVGTANSYAWLEQISQMNRQICMVTNTDLNVEFISQYTLDFLEREFDLTDIPSPLPYKLVIRHMAQNGCFGDGNVEDIIQALTSRNEVQLTALPQTSDELDIMTPSGCRIHVKQTVMDDGRLLLVGNDISEEYIEEHALRLALDSSRSGYGFYNLETRTFKIHGDILRDSFRLDGFGNITMENMMKTLHPDDYEKCFEGWTQGLSSGKPWELTYRLIRDDGRIVWTNCQFTPQVTKDGKFSNVICFFRDVTNTIRVQNELRQVTERTQDTLKAKNAFIGRLSHEMRTPMNAVIGIADALVHHHGTPVTKPKLELIQTSAHNILRILDETLQHAKLEEHKVELNPRPAPPSKCVESLCQLWEEKAIENGIKLSYQIDENVPSQIIFDDFRFEQCLNNLLSNAIKFTAGGEIKVIQTVVEQEQQRYLITAIKDNGIGMTPEQQENIFTAFTQADRSISGRFGGTGLGMSITKNIIELMGGRISVNSVLGEGSVFALSLPIGTVFPSQKPESVTEDPAKTSKAVNRSLVETLLEENAPEPTEYDSLRVLVVDDNPTNHLVMKSLLESVVGEIVTANNGVQAIQVLENETVDLVFMDIHMPIMDGIEATLAIRGCDEAFTDIPIVALTADPQYQQKRLCKNIGMDGALAKPVRLNDLLEEIDKILEARKDLNQAAA